MRRITCSELGEWAGAEIVGNAAVAVGPDVVIDSRQATPGALFVALAGEHSDGHEFIEGAAGAGAVAVVCERLTDTRLTQLLVRDAPEALARIATAAVAEAAEQGLAVVGITGSAGKTSTKDLVAQVLAEGGPTVAPVGSFNNEIGVPLTACRIDRDTRFLVAEMGARGLGHVSWLCSITPPQVGLVLNVGSAHIGEFGSVEAIAEAKGELIEAVPPDGWAVLNADDPRVAGMGSRTRARTALFSTRGDPGGAALRVWATEISADEEQRHTFTLHTAGLLDEAAPVALQVLGEHQVSNALAAAGVGLVLGLPLAGVARALSAATSRSRWRMEKQTRADGLVILNDSYNANPDSMAAALRSVVRMRRPGGRVLAVLGDMLELGETSEDAHVRVGRQAAELGVDHIVALGEFGPAMVAGVVAAGGSGAVATDQQHGFELINEALSSADVVLVKASRGLALDRLAERLLTEPVVGEEG